MVNLESIHNSQNALMMAILSSLTLLLTNCSSGESKAIVTKQLVLESTVTLDSIAPTFNFYPERWTTDGEYLWIINCRDSMFLKKYCPVKNQILWAGGSIGRGNKEYILPGIIEGIAKCKFSLYSNTLDRVDEYIVAEEPILHRSTRLPVWNEMHGVPKPYTRMARVNDSIAIGTYFLPNKAGADVMNIYSSSLLGEFPIGMKSDENVYSGPYEFKIASDENYAVVGYRYIDRLEFYSVCPSGNITLSHALGNSDTQTSLYNADRDDEMIKYYSDLFVYGGYLFTLYQGIEDGRLDEACTHLEVYDLETGRNVANISLGREMSELQVMPDIDMIALYSASNPDILYKCRLSEVFKDVE